MRLVYFDLDPGEVVAAASRLARFGSGPEQDWVGPVGASRGCKVATQKSQSVWIYIKVTE